MKKRNRVTTVYKGGLKGKNGNNKCVFPSDFESFKLDTAPKSAPTMTIERPKSDGRTHRKSSSSRVFSMPVLSDKQESIELKELHKKQSITKYSESEFGSMYSSGGCSDLLSDLEIMSSKSKHSSQKSSKMNIDHRTVGTNYSSNDFGKT